MITLRRLTAEHFKGLASVDLSFPEQGSILIEGHNEAGKSTLCEAIYIALYGEPLVGEDSRARLEEVIAHGQAGASVELTVAVGAHELTIRRTFVRGRAQLQQAKLTIRRPDVPTEVISRIRPVNERILRELGGLDGDSLRNSCFVEQQELGRLESLSRVEREQAVHKLLGLERLTTLAQRFRYTREQERELQAAERFRDLAAAQAEVELLAREAAGLVARRGAAQVVAHLDRRAETRRDANETQRLLDASRAQEAVAREGIDRCARLRRVLVDCDGADVTAAALRRAHETLAATEADLAELNRLARDDEPVVRERWRRVTAAVQAATRLDEASMRVEQVTEAVRAAAERVDAVSRADEAAAQRRAEVKSAAARYRQRTEEAQAGHERAQRRIDGIVARRDRLVDARRLVAAWEEAQAGAERLVADITTAREAGQRLAALEDELARRERDLEQARAEAATAECEAVEASAQARASAARAALRTWARLKGVEARIASYDDERAGLVRERTAAVAALAVRQHRSRTLGIATGAGGGATLLAGAGGFAWPPLFALAVLALLASLALGVLFFRARRDTATAATSAAALEARLRDLDVAHAATIQAGGNPGALAACEATLRDAGMAIPVSVAAAEASLAAEAGGAGEEETRTLQEQERGTAARAAGAAERTEQAGIATDEARHALDTARADDPATRRRSLETELIAQKGRVVSAEEIARAALGADIPWPADTRSVDAALALSSSEEQAARQALTEQDAEAATGVTVAAGEVQAAQQACAEAERVANELRADDPEGALARARTEHAEARAVEASAGQDLEPLAAEVGIAPERAALETERGRVEERLHALQGRLAGRDRLAETVAQRAEQMTTARDEARQAVAAVIAALRPLLEANLAPAGLADAETTPDRLAAAIEDARTRATARLAALDEAALHATLDAALHDAGIHTRRLEEVKALERDLTRAIVDLLAAHERPVPAEVTAPHVVDAWPLVALTSASELPELTARLEDTERRLYAAQQRVAELAAALDHDGTPLDLDECARRVAALHDEREIRREAIDAIRDAQERIARHVLPTTERNMQFLLPQLTAERYRDVRLTAPEGEDGEPGEMDYRIRVWDPMAGRYVAKNLFSGGTRDQCSLALRLAFALATLPQELGVAPGFIILDEPLTAFDAERAQDLVALLTTGTIAEQFAQVIVISHGHAFDRAAFAYRLVMEHGRVRESTLPGSVDAEMPAEQLETGEDDHHTAGVAR